MRYRSEVLTCIVVGRFRYRMVRQPIEALLHFLLLCYIYGAPFIDLLDHVTPTRDEQFITKPNQIYSEIYNNWPQFDANQLVTNKALNTSNS